MSRSLLKRRAKRGLVADDLSGRLATVLDPSGGAAEDYRSLRTSLMYAFVDNPPKVIVVTSPGSAEGKSTTCANLGVALAQADKSALIVDCDLRKPTIHKIFSLWNMRGMVDVLVEEQSLQRVCQETPVQGLDVITTGPLPPNPAELLSSRRFAEFTAEARQKYDYVLMDVPPVNAVSDPTIAATQADGVLLVLDAQYTRKAAVRQSIRSMKAVGATMLGTVMNNVKASRSGYYYKYGEVY